MAMGALSLAMLPMNLAQGFLFGTGYGSGVRFGYEDVYPYLKGNMGQIANMLGVPFAGSGFKLASGVTERQGMGLTGIDSVIGSKSPVGNLTTPEANTPQMSPSGQVSNVKTYDFPDKHMVTVTANNVTYTNVTALNLQRDKLQIQRFGQDVWLDRNSLEAKSLISKYFT